jgi:hypothetical protein
MTISQYWVGQKPAHPITIDVKDSDGRLVDLSGYTDFTVRLVGSDNEDIDTSGVELQTAGAKYGRFVLRWPSTESLFYKPGEYLLQLEFSNDTNVDFTTTHDIRVRQLGGRK